MKADPKLISELSNRFWRKWTPSSLAPKYNRDFSQLIVWQKAGALVEIEDAWRIELDRELGLDCPPFLATWNEKNFTEVPDLKKLSGLRELFSTNDYSQHARLHCDIKTVMLEIDTSFSISEIVESFQHWLENDCYPHSAQNNFGKGQPGRKNQFLSWFKELAIYRCESAGIKRKRAESDWLADFLKNLKMVPTAKGKSGPDAKISEFYWSHAVDRTRIRIFERMVLLMRHRALVKRGPHGKLDVNDNWQKYLGKLR